MVFGVVILIARVPLRKFVRAVREPAALAFATTSSESALPKAMESMERLGVPRHIVGFVMTTGYSFNLDWLDTLPGAGFGVRSTGGRSHYRSNLGMGPPNSDGADANDHIERGGRGPARVACDLARHGKQLPARWPRAYRRGGHLWR